MLTIFAEPFECDFVQCRACPRLNRSVGERPRRRWRYKRPKPHVGDVSGEITQAIKDVGRIYTFLSWHLEKNNQDKQRTQYRRASFFTI